MNNTHPRIGLDELPTDGIAEIITLDGRGAVVGRLAALGFVPGMRVSMVQNRGHGPLIVSVINTRVALGRREAVSIRARRITA
ncbi:MAG TPA: FeoA family protein [Anaerolineae bacterium]